MKNISRSSKGQGGAFVVVASFFVIMFVAIIIIALGIDTVDASHLGVMVQFGKIIDVQEPGIRWTGIFVDVPQYDLRTRKAVVELTGANSAVDKSGQAVYATINVNYRVKPTKETVIALYSNVGTNDVIDDRLNIHAIIAEGFKQATVKYDALEILDKRQEVKELAINNIRQNFPANYFEIQDIVITNIDFSPQFKQAIEDKKTAEQNAIKEKNNLEVVKFQQQQEIEKYKAEAEKMRLQKSEVSALLNQQKWIERWDGKLPQYMITGEGTGNFILQIPTPQSIQQ